MLLLFMQQSLLLLLSPSAVRLAYPVPPRGRPAIRCAASPADEAGLASVLERCGEDPTALVYGQSITDACISWQATEELLEEFARAVRARRG